MCVKDTCPAMRIGHGVDAARLLDDEVREVVDSLRSGWVTTGPKVKRFEADFANYVGARHAIAVSSCTAALHLALASLDIGPGAEVIVPTLTFCATANVVVHVGARPVVVDVREDFQIDPQAVERAITPRTRAIVVNSPHNPTGKVFRRDELELIARLCEEFHALAFTDDIYEHIVFDGEHIPLATLPGMADRTVSIHSMSKTYSVTGWRIGWAIAPPALSVGIRRVHDFLTVGAAAPLQSAAVVALGFPDAYYDDLVAAYRARRDILVPALSEAGFRVHDPAGAYYVMTDISDLAADGEDDVAFTLRLIRYPGVAAVPGSSFFSRPELGRTKVRFAFPKRTETLVAAAERLDRLAVRP
jgi:aminotransferase